MVDLSRRVMGGAWAEPVGVREFWRTAGDIGVVAALMALVGYELFRVAAAPVD